MRGPRTVCRMSTPNERVAGEVRAALARAQVTQTALAEQTERSQTYWSRRLSGDIPLDVDDLAAVSAATGVPLAALVAAA